MVAHAAMSPSHHFVTTLPHGPWPLVQTPRPREHDIYMRDFDHVASGTPTHEDHYSRPEQYGHYQRASLGYDLGPGHHSHGTDPSSDPRYWYNPTYGHVTENRERDLYRERSPKYDSAPLYRERDGHRMNTPAHEAASSNRGRGGFGSGVRIHSDSRYDRSPSYDQRGASHRRSSDYYRSERTQPPRGKRQPLRSRGFDFLSQSNNPNSILILKCGAETVEKSPRSVRDRANIPPPRFVETSQASPSRQDDFLPLESASDRHFPLNGIEKDVANVQPFCQTESRNSTKPLPLSGLPTNIHPSRRAAISQDLPVEEGRSRQIASMSAPHKHQGTIMQSIEPAEKTIPSFLRLGDNANAVPLGPGKKMRF